eukprot:TRINITY_DN106242_c0_g1_i1.p1 TRINITY_DN106242_c0_g1~~TRINITY_DN106242_c0_g1_i1.p1  ORF type:complete len:444 (-),score=89.16 TRINITY_DN106242_c0_g1_i1:39-1370(-)
MFSGLVNSFKGLMGWEQDLQVESGGNQEDSVKHQDLNERQSLFKQLSQFIGKDITSMISLPVWIFEPFSFLQVMCEPMQYEELLNKAANSPDSCYRIAYLAAFIVAGYSCAVRTKKPFNPLLGETFEFLDSQGKWKFFAEQVSHHPPIGVAEALSELYKLHLEMELKTKFTGNSSDVVVLGSNHFYIEKFNDHFSWGHLDTCAHNVIVGGMWVDHFGTLEIVNHTTGDKCVVKVTKAGWLGMWVDHFGTLEIVNHTTGDKCVVKVTKAGWLGAGRFETNAEIFDNNGKLRLKINGKWNDSLYAIKVENGSESEPILLWKKANNPPHKWNWPKFNDDLCYMDSHYEKILPETDSRLRGDRRALEKGDVDAAGKEKHRLEEEQRAKRKQRETNNVTYEPAYFKKESDEKWGHIWTYKGDYWGERENRIKATQESQTEETKQETQN